MKKIFSTIFLLAVIPSLVFIHSCKKDISSSTIFGKRDSNIHHKFLSIASSQQTGKQNKVSMKWLCGVAVADVCGAEAGAWLGGEIGTALAFNTAAGALIGGILCGAAGSYGMAIVKLAPKPQKQFNPPSSGSNPFEEAGVGHNKWLDRLMSDQKGLYEPYKEEMSPMELLVLSKSNSLIERTFSYFSAPNADPYEYLNSEIKDEKVQQLTKIVFEGINACSDWKDAIALVDKFEQEAMIAEDLTESEKTTLLIGLSVAKYSIAYWNS